MDPIIIIGFSVFLFIGAYFGWKAQSKVSLIMGFVSGGLVLLGGYLITVNARAGYSFLTVIALLLAGAFVMRLLKTKKVMPSGMLLVVSFSFFIFCLVRLLNP